MIGDRGVLVRVLIVLASVTTTLAVAQHLAVANHTISADQPDWETPAERARRKRTPYIRPTGSSYYVWVNGDGRESSEASKIPSDFDVSTFHSPGTNDISIEMHRGSREGLEDQDCRRVSGMKRGVDLSATTATRDDDLTVGASLDQIGCDGRLEHVFSLITEQAQKMTINTVGAAC